VDSQSELDLIPQLSTKTQTEPFYELAPPGRYIQFFLGANSSPGYVMPVGTEPETASLYKHTSIFGTTSSTIDDMPHTPLDGTELSQQATFSVYKSHFGALSEDGIFFLQARLAGTFFRTLRSTKLDIPGSWLQINTTRLPSTTVTHGQGGRNEVSEPLAPERHSDPTLGLHQTL